MYGTAGVGLIQSLQNVNKRKHVCPKFATQARLSCFQSPLTLSLPDKAHTPSVIEVNIHLILYDIVGLYMPP